MLNKLVGAQIVQVHEDFIEVKLDGKMFTLSIVSDIGGCCGYAGFETRLLYDPSSIRNPVIVDVKEESEDSPYGKSVSIVTFYGEHAELASIESEAGSDSGWTYGAHVSVVCKELEIEKDLASW